MARRRTLDRKANRGEYEDDDTPREIPESEELSEELEADEELAESDAEEEISPKPKKKKSASTRSSSRSRTRTPKISRLKAYWGVFDNAGKLVQKFDYRARAEAEAFMAEKMSGEKKPLMYIQLHKEAIEE